MAALKGGSCAWVVGGMGGDCRREDEHQSGGATAPRTASRGTRHAVIG